MINLTLQKFDTLKIKTQPQHTKITTHQKNIFPESQINMHKNFYLKGRLTNLLLFYYRDIRGE